MTHFRSCPPPLSGLAPSRCLGTAPAAAAARSQQLFPNQGKEDRVGCGLFALLLLLLSSPHRSDPLTASLRAEHLGGDRALSQRHQNQDEKQAGGVIGFNKPNKTSHAFHEPLCRPQSSATALSHSRCQSSAHRPAAHLQTLRAPRSTGRGGARARSPPPHRPVCSLLQPHTWQPPTRSGLQASPLMPGPRRLTLTKSQGCPQLPCPGRGPQNQPVSLGFRQVTFSPIQLLSLHLPPPPN